MPVTQDHETGVMVALDDAEAIAEWMAHGWRGRWNQHRAMRLYQAAQHSGRDWDKAIPWHGTNKQARETFPWLSAMPELVLQSPERLEEKDWFAAVERRSTSGGNLSWKFKRRHEHLGFTCWHNNGKGTEVAKLNRRTSIVWIKGNGWRLGVRFRHSPNMAVRTYTSVHVNLLTNSVVFTNPPEALTPGTGIIGVDLGIANTVTTSNGEVYDIPRPTDAENRRYKALQREMARQDRTNKAQGRNKWDSQRRAKTLAEIQRLAGRQARRRRDWVEKTTTTLIQQNATIVVEKLSSAAMSRAGKRKAGLNRGILESCWGLFQQRLTDKADLAGVELIWVDPAYTSQMCNQCGHITKENRKNQADFSCVKCAHADNADINAAKNIRDVGLGHSLRRGANTRPVNERRRLVKAQQQAIVKRQALQAA